MQDELPGVFMETIGFHEFPRKDKAVLESERLCLCERNAGVCTEQPYEEQKWSKDGNLGSGFDRESHPFPRSDDSSFGLLPTSCKAVSIL